MKRTLLMAFASVASVSVANAYVSNEGHEYRSSCNYSGYVLTSIGPVSRPIGFGAETRYIRGREKIFLGKSCDAFHQILGKGKWCWSNGAFGAEFENHQISFPRQEIVCPRSQEFYTEFYDDCSC
jgi:hypothetical protein